MSKYFPHTIFTQFNAATNEIPFATIKATCSGVNVSISHKFDTGYDQCNHVQAVHSLLTRLIDTSVPYVIHTAAYTNGYAHIVELNRM